MDGLCITIIQIITNINFKLKTVGIKLTNIRSKLLGFLAFKYINHGSKNNTKSYVFMRLKDLSFMLLLLPYENINKEEPHTSLVANNLRA